MRLEDLPDEVLVRVLSFLGGRDVLNASLVCRKWKTFTSEASLWRRLYAEEGPNMAAWGADPAGGDPRRAWLHRDAVRRLSHDSHVRLCMHQDTPSLHIKTASGDDRFMQLSDKSHFPNVHLDVSPCGLYVVYALYTNLEDPPVRGFGCSRLDGTGCITVQTRAVPFYFSWSPDSRYVAWLGSHQDNITFEVVDLHAATPVSQVLVDNGAPVFFDWHPSGRRIVMVFGDRLLFDITVSGSAPPVVDLVSRSTGRFNGAPRWMTSARDNNHALMCSLDGQDLCVTVVDMDARAALKRIVVSSDSMNRFVPLVASISPRFDTIIVTERPSGSTLYKFNPDVSDENDRGVKLMTFPDSTGAFWNPAGTTAAFLLHGSENIAFATLTDASLRVDRCNPEIAKPLFILYYRQHVQFHYQYDLSTRLWSADGTRFCFPAKFADGEQCIADFSPDGRVTRISDIEVSGIKSITQFSPI